MTEPKKLTPEEVARIQTEAGSHRIYGGRTTVGDLLAHIAALEQIATVKGALNYCVLANAERDAAIARAEAAGARVKALTEALEGIVELYVDLTVEKDPENNIMVMEARAALSSAKEPTT